MGITNIMELDEMQFGINPGRGDAIFIISIKMGIMNGMELDEMQFGINPGRGDAIFIIRQLQEKFRAKLLYYAFVDLERAYDRMPREVVRWATRDAGLDEWLVDTVM